MSSLRNPVGEGACWPVEVLKCRQQGSPSHCWVQSPEPRQSGRPRQPQHLSQSLHCGILSRHPSALREMKVSIRKVRERRWKRECRTQGYKGFVRGGDRPRFICKLRGRAKAWATVGATSEGAVVGVRMHWDTGIYLKFSRVWPRGTARRGRSSRKHDDAHV